MKLLRLFVLIISLIFISTPLMAADICVENTLDNNLGMDSDCDEVCTPGGPCQLRDAIDVANADNEPDQIIFEQGVTGTLTQIDGNHWAVITTPVQIVGPGLDVLTIEAGNNSNCFEIADGGNGFDIGVSGLTLTGANSEGLFLVDGNLTVNSVLINENEGTGIVADLGELTVYHSTISNNMGGGMFADTTVVTSISHSTFSGNEHTVSKGGAIELRGSTTTITNTTIHDNMAIGIPGGGINTENGTDLTILNSTITGNSADTGGGVNFGGGTIINIQNTIIAENTATVSGPDCKSDFTSEGGNLIGNGDDCAINNQQATDLVGDTADPVDPVLGPLQNNGGETETRQLLSGSPAIDAGLNNGCPAEDQRGTTRPLDGLGNGAAPVCDKGAVEAGRVDLAVTSPDAQFNFAVKQQGVGDDLSFSITLTNKGPDYAPGVTLNSTLPAALILIAATIQGGNDCDINVALDSVTCDLGNVEAGASVIINLVVNAEANGTFNFTVTANTTGEDTDPNDNEVSFTVNIGGGGGCALNRAGESQKCYGYLLLMTIPGLILFRKRFGNH